MGDKCGRVGEEQGQQGCTGGYAGREGVLAVGLCHGYGWYGAPRKRQRAIRLHVSFRRCPQLVHNIQRAEVVPRLPGPHLTCYLRLLRRFCIR